MTTIVIENADNKNALLISELAKALGLSVSTKQVRKTTPGVITNSELIKRIEKVEKNMSRRKIYSAEQLKTEIAKMTAENA